jgi:hypothetical protein
VLLACARGRLSRAKIAEVFQVAEGTVRRWLQTWRTEARREAKPHAGGPAPRLDTATLGKFEAIVAEANDLSLAGRARGGGLGARGRDGERPDRVPGAAQAGAAPGKRPCARTSRIARASLPPAPPGGPTWPRPTRGG